MTGRRHHFLKVIFRFFGIFCKLYYFKESLMGKNILAFNLSSYIIMVQGILTKRVILVTRGFPVVKCLGGVRFCSTIGESCLIIARLLHIGYISTSVMVTLSSQHYVATVLKHHSIEKCWFKKNEYLGSFGG